MELHKFFKLTLSSMSLHAVLPSLYAISWADMQFHELACSSFLCLSSSQEFRSACSCRLPLNEFGILLKSKCNVICSVVVRLHSQFIPFYFNNPRGSVPCINRERGILQCLQDCYVFFYIINYEVLKSISDMLIWLNNVFVKEEIMFNE